MDNNQNNGQPMNEQGFVQPQQFDNAQQGFVQPQQFDNMQQGFAQPQQFDNMQQGYVQPQMQYQNMQQGYMQPQQGYAQPQMNYGQPQMQAGPKKPINKKALAIVAAVAVVAILAIIIIPKLLKGSSKTPFEDIKLGMSMSEVAKALDMEPEYDEDTWYKRGIEGFGAEGKLQLIFSSDGKLDHVNWYVDMEDCESPKAYKDSIKNIKEYYTDKYGKPEEDDEEWSWELSMGLEYELEIQDEDEYVLRYR